MLLNPPDIHVFGQGIESWKLWGFLLSTFTGAVIAGYKGYQWIKDIREKDLVEVKGSLSTVVQKIEDTSAAQLRSTEFQTTALVRELSELRGLFYGAFHIPQQTLAPVRSKPKRKPATTKKPAKKAIPRVAMAAARKK